MPRYYFSCTFVYDGTPENIHRGLSQWLNDLGDDFTVKLKSSLTDGVPTVDSFREALATFPEDSLSLLAASLGLEESTPVDGTTGEATGWRELATASSGVRARRSGHGQWLAPVCRRLGGTAEPQVPGSRPP